MSPDHDGSRAVVTRRNRSLESRIIVGMILNHHRKPLRFHVRLGSFRNGPGLEHAIELEPEIVMKVRGVMFWMTKSGFFPHVWLFQKVLLSG